MHPNTHFVLRVATVTLVSLGAFTVGSMREDPPGQPRAFVGPGPIKHWVQKAHRLELKARLNMPPVFGWRECIAPPEEGR